MPRMPSWTESAIMMLELKLILLCLPSILLATTLDTDNNKSVLANADWKKLWLESGQLSSGSARIDNHLDSSDSTLIDDGEVMAHNTTVQLGGVAFLVCKVAGVDRNQISWIRRRDWHILSSGAQMYTNDERFAILHTPGSNTWTLQIKFVQRRDHGTYECQVSTPTGIISHFVNLQVVVPEAFILGSGELHVDMGSTINLVCIIEKSPQPPQYVYWQRNDRMINYDDSRRDISIETTPGPRTQSRLIIREPQINDSGNYTCSASNTEPASIYVFVSKVCNGSPLSRESSESNESNESLEDIRAQCIENTGSDADFPKFMASVEQAMLCLAGFDSKNFINDIRHLSNATRATFFPKYCPKIRSLVSCIDGSLLGMQPCLDEDVFKIAEALIESIPDAVDLACKNDGEIFLKLEDEERQECIMENTVQLSECVETLSTNFDNAIELFELTQGQCRELVIFRECMKEQLDPCDLSDIVSIYDIPMNAILPLTPCANYTHTPMVYLLDKN